MYNKIFSKIVDSSIWLEPTPTRLVWVMFIAVMDEDGFVAITSAANVAHKARLTLEETEKALRCLESPDRNSPDQEHEGRRIERVPDGWIVIKAKDYRSLVTKDIAREQIRIRVARHREKQRKSGNVTVTPVTKRNDSVTQSVSDAVSGSDIVFTKVNTHPVSALEIYKAYPRKVAKPAAIRAIEKAMKIRPAAELLKLTVAFAATQLKNDPFTPHPATWFNQQRFADDPETWDRRNGRDSLSPAERRQAEIDQANREYRERKERKRQEGKP